MRYAVFLCMLFTASGETLHYAINWPSGLSLGEATLSSTVSKEGVTSDFEIDAGVPGFAIRDHYHSSASEKFCSTKLDKSIHRGSHKNEETVTFHQDKHTITRQTHADGGKSDVDVTDCARDALTYLAFARQELAQGRLAPPQSVVLGGLYNVRLDAAGTQPVNVSGKAMDADRIQATIKGPASNLTVEIFFARDSARTPVLIRIPLPLGTFTAELIH